jgi:hypothetical protein
LEDVVYEHDVVDVEKDPKEAKPIPAWDPPADFLRERGDDNNFLTRSILLSPECSVFISYVRQRTQEKNNKMEKHEKTGDDTEILLTQYGGDIQILCMT